MMLLTPDQRQDPVLDIELPSREEIMGSSGDYHSMAPEIYNEANQVDKNADGGIASVEEFQPKQGFFMPDFIPSETTMVQALYLSMFAILGTLLRIVIAQLFGEECANPGTVGWLKASSPLCVTKNGETNLEGGIIFADFPANLLGSFFMGVLQNGFSLGLPVNMPIAWLNPSHIFQSMTILHLGLRTGFCGSLTTFSSWNSEMVVLIFHGAGDTPSNFIRALFGYLIGMETALGSYVFGRTVAVWLHKWQNPLLDAENQAMEQRAAEGVHLNKQLPEFERRFLPNLPMEIVGHVYPVNELECLERWRRSTWDARRVGHSLLPTLIEIENSIFVNSWPIAPEAESIARANNWDVNGLKEWVQHRATDCQRLPSISSFQSEMTRTENKLFTVTVAGSILAVIIALLLLGLVFFRKETAYSITDRTSCFAMLCAPFGAVLRWRIGKLNGKLPHETLGWLPIGTLAANILASMVSIAMIATEYRVGDFSSFWTAGSLRAIRVGFAGSLSTVSTFVAEVSSFGKNKRQDLAYTYVIISLGSSCLLGSIIFGLIVYV
jgi:CrcB protein